VRNQQVMMLQLQMTLLLKVPTGLLMVMLLQRLL
jgi:hypothetical protein